MGAVVRASSRRATELHPLIHAAAAKSREEGVGPAPMRKRDMEAEIGRFMEVYNEAWGDNWGFVPITEAEVAFQAKNLKPVLDENWAMIAERDGEVVGAALTLPDVDQVLAKMNGRAAAVRLGPLPAPASATSTGCGSSRSASSPSTSTSASPRRSTSATSRRPRPIGPRGGHMGWILETNEPMNRAMEGMGGKVVQRYRIYERGLSRASA